MSPSNHLRDNQNRMIDVGGWVGMVMIFLAFLLNVIDMLPADELFYLGLNLVGSVLLGIYAYAEKAFPSAVINVLWFVVAVVGIISWVLARV